MISSLNKPLEEIVPNVMKDVQPAAGPVVPRKRPKELENLLSDSLLQPPLRKASGSDQIFDTLARASSTSDELERLRHQYILKDRVYRQQYASVYFNRLVALRPVVKQAAERKWCCNGRDKEGPPFVEKVLDISSGKMCYIIGTVYVDMPLKPNILDDVTKEHHIAAPPPRAKYTSGKDKIVLEDESGRVTLNGDVLKQGGFVSGVVIAVLGKETPNGEFYVADYCLPGLAPQKPISLSSSESQRKYVALLSGLDVGSQKPISAAIHMLMECFTGELGCREDQNRCSSIVRIVLAGNSLAAPVIKEDERKSKRFGQDIPDDDVEPLRQLDNLLEDACSTVATVDMLPGETDPANAALPQQALHFSLFPRSHCYSSFRPVTNPYWMAEDGVCFLGTGGQTVSDMYKYIDECDRLDLAVSTLRWRHIAPTAPDTLWSYPFRDEDPFILTESPHVYFIGNQPEFATAFVEGDDGQNVRVILLPSFDKTGIVVLVDLQTLECHPMVLETEL